MPIKVQSDLPAKGILENENIFVMDEYRATHQNIRPLQICILNLMPIKQDTELQLLRALSNTPLQIDVSFMKMNSHVSLNTPIHHLNKFYNTFDELKEKRYDGLIITGAPVEQIPFEEVDYWPELCEIMDWTKSHVTSTFHICWAAQAGLYYHFGIPKYPLDKKMFGIFPHKAEVENCQLLRGFDDVFFVPHSRNSEIRREDIEKVSQLEILTSSDISGVHIVANKNGRQYFITGHSEYDRDTIANEYFRDMQKGIDIQLPYNYFPDDNPNNTPKFSWRCTANLMFSNWLNYCVYQLTPFNLEELDIRNWKWQAGV